MRVIVTGATGNVGTSVIQALSDSSQVDEAVGLARRRPAWSPRKTSWVDADVLDPSLAELFEGADAVVHLAWAIQPSRDEATLERINVEGSRNVFEAAAAAGVPRLVHASSVGAYSPGPKDRQVDESWPTDGVQTSFYSRHKAAVERILDDFERRNEAISVARLRPALIFKGDAATEIRRYFIGPLLPNALVRPGLIPILPRLQGLRFQAVHSADVGRAYLQAVLGEAGGAFNIAAEPVLDVDRLAELFDAKPVPIPSGAARRLVDASWRLRLQPTPPDWLDMAVQVPLMSSRRARDELGWEPRLTGVEALEELIDGLRDGRGFPTPPLQGSGLRGRLDEVRTGVGGRQWRRDRDEQLVKYLTDIHSIEEQALVQMRKAPRLAGDPSLGELFEQHERETAEQERRVRDLLEARGAGPSAVKDLAGRGGGYGMIIFARVQPDTPRLLAAHSFSYEHMELAAYELLRRLAEEAGDEEAARVAREIAGEERRMADRIADCFDGVVDASLAGMDRDGIERQLVKHLADLHAIEQQAKQLLRPGPLLLEDEELTQAFAEHLEETKAHEERLEQRLEAHGAGPSAAKDTALRIGGLNVGGFFGAQPDTTTKLAGFAFAFEALEIAAYELLKRVAQRAGDSETVVMAERTLSEERRAAERVASTWDRPGVASGLVG